MTQEYIKRVNKILVFIDEHLEDHLSLDNIAELAYYSPFHLHRIFKAVTNETLYGYILRKRLEKAAAILIHQKEISMASISLKFGFTSNASFTRAFKKMYLLNPTDFRKANYAKFSKISIIDSKIRQNDELPEAYICNINNLKNWIKMNAKIEIKKIDQMDIAFITQIGVNGVDAAFDKLFKWAKPKGLIDPNNLKILRIYHDSFKITEQDKVRMSLGINLTHLVNVEGEIGITKVEKGNYIVGHFEIEPKDFEKAWSSLFIWLNENGYQKANNNPFEIIYNNFNDHPQKKCIVDLHIPVI